MSTTDLVATISAAAAVVSAVTGVLGLRRLPAEPMSRFPRPMRRAVSWSLIVLSAVAVAIFFCFAVPGAPTGVMVGITLGPSTPVTVMGTPPTTVPTTAQTTSPPTTTAPPPPPTPSGPSALSTACAALRRAALDEETALLALQSAVTVNGSSEMITGASTDYSNLSTGARVAVTFAYNRLGDFEGANGTLPSFGEEVNYARDLRNLRDQELSRIDDGVTGAGKNDHVTDYKAWNSLNVYAENAHMVGFMQCP